VAGTATRPRLAQLVRASIPGVGRPASRGRVVRERAIVDARSRASSSHRPSAWGPGPGSDREARRRRLRPPKSRPAPERRARRMAAAVRADLPTPGARKARRRRRQQQSCWEGWRGPSHPAPGL